MIRPVKVKKELDFWAKIYVIELFRGLVITARHFFRNLFNPKKFVTIQYPEKKIEVTERWRFRHRLTKKDDGVSPRCTACMLCATACPANCISIVAGEHPDPKVEKYPLSYVIDELRCVFCGLCVEACPCDAIRMDTGIYFITEYRREEFIYRKEKLLENGFNNK